MKESSKQQSSRTRSKSINADTKINGKISIEEAKEALRRSGYILEHRVENLLRRREWYVATNSPYEDHQTLKSRELDVYATKVSEIGAFDTFTGMILAECVNNAQPLAFITKEDKSSIFFGSDIKLDVGLDEPFYENLLESCLANFLGLQEFHHYYFGRVATQYCSFNLKGKSPREWMATHDEGHHGCFTTLVKALEQRIQRQGVSFMSGCVNGIIIYPMLVLQGDLLDVRLNGSDLTIETVSHVKYRRSVTCKGEETGYIIDVVTENGLPEFLDKLEHELTQTLDCIRVNIDILRRNVKDTVFPIRADKPTESA